MQSSTLQTRAANALVFAFPILILCVPKGAGVFLAGVLLLIMLGWRTMGQSWRQHSNVLWPLTLAVIAFLSVFLASKVVHHTPWDVLDNPSRALLAILACWAITNAKPDPSWLWRGITLGLVLALAIVVFQRVVLGEPRPGAWLQAIAFANMVTALSLIGFARPGNSRKVHAHAWMDLACGALILMLNGTRGAMVALLVALVPMLMIRYRRVGFRMFLAAVCGTITIAAAAYFAPGSPVPNRMDQAIYEMREFEQGQFETSVGVRLKIWQLGLEYFSEHPVSGIGVGQFARILHATPVCHQNPQSSVCILEHAHNDLVEVAATTGVLGLAAFLALFLVPAALFRRALRRSRPGQSSNVVSLAGAGMGFVLASLICGLTQVTMAHQANVVFYSGVIGLVLGMVASESSAARRCEEDVRHRQASVPSPIA